MVFSITVETNWRLRLTSLVETIPRSLRLSRCDTIDTAELYKLEAGPQRANSLPVARAFHAALRCDTWPARKFVTRSLLGYWRLKQQEVNIVKRQLSVGCNCTLELLLDKAS